MRVIWRCVKVALRVGRSRGKASRFLLKRVCCVWSDRLGQIILSAMFSEVVRVRRLRVDGIDIEPLVTCIEVIGEGRPAGRDLRNDTKEELGRTGQCV